MYRYEQIIERNIELESTGDQNIRKVGELETDLKQTKEKLNECQVIIY